MSGNRESRSGHGEAHHDDPSYPATGLGLGLERLPPNLHLSYSQFPTSYPQSLSGFDYPTSEYQPREPNTAPFLPEILALSPQSGDIGELIIVSVRSGHDLSNSHNVSLSVSFSGIVCPVSIQPLSSHVGLQAFQYAISFRVPPLQHAGNSMPLSCPMELNLHSSQPQISGTVPIGAFSLRSASVASQSSHSASSAPSVALSRSDSSLDTGTMTSRRSSQQAQHDDVSVIRGSPYAQPLLYQGLTPAALAPSAQPPRSQAYGPVQNMQAHDQLKRSSSVPSPRTWDDDEDIHPAHKSYSYPLESERRSPAASTSTYLRRSPPSTPGMSTGSNPPLVRTSTLASGASSSAAAAAGFSSPGSSHGFNPYAMYPNKALLKIDGDLDRMAYGWSDEEITTKRRLVEFKRSQNGNTITTTFKPVTLEQRAPNSICVSCVWWEEKDECFVTSVDTIQLLESLVGVRFTVEEKNRIRRNLEGFRPLTVAKGKAESERFFKVIMDFPNPKPRNIEKDVKVFPWKILSNALKKIIGKYSASYASTASSLHHPTALDGPNTSASLDQGRYYGSPLSQSSSTFSVAGGLPAAPPRSSYMSTPASSEPGSAYSRQQPFPGAHVTPVHTPQPAQYMSYGPVEYTSWPMQEQQPHPYNQGQQLHRSWTPQYNLDGSPLATSTPQFAPAPQPVTLPLQQRRGSQVHTGFGQYMPHGSPR